MLTKVTVCNISIKAKGNKKIRVSVLLGKMGNSVI